MKKVGRRVGILTTVAMIGATVAGCSADSYEPSPQAPLGTVDNLQILSPEGNVEAFVLGKLYETALEERGRSVSLQLVEGTLATQLKDLRGGPTDIVIGCAGELLEFYNPDLADELKEEYAQVSVFDRNSGEWREKVYDALQGSLPTSLSATDPSNAVGCQNNTSLPQNLVPIYRKPNLARYDRDTLNLVSGALTTGELREMVRSSSNTGTISNSALDFLRSKGL
ncbi:hypothetical protein CDES_05455 [Corynebacterium deserti GIMN1.010]|uniref:Uncharacterized protein n=1 Tax=Corynebacterium deserti GIMN1.010 TaxID=931089 RepID=A0A0M4CDF0_9CORY|nr:hypothetical protein [Corynebacterium deserti]ALC05528.1 hypothetical protein CDES_05455 [Corynebacterium deserti GIMN1.010]